MGVARQKMSCSHPPFEIPGSATDIVCVCGGGGGGGRSLARVIITEKGFSGLPMGNSFSSRAN